MDLLEDRLEIERRHRHDAEQRQCHGRRPRREPQQEEDPAHDLDHEEPEAERVALDTERRHEQHPEDRRNDERDAEMHAEHERAEPRETLERPEDARLGHLALHERGDGRREPSDRERGDDRECHEQRVIGGVLRRVGEPLDVTR